jgi:hypothetical protein
MPTSTIERAEPVDNFTNKGEEGMGVLIQGAWRDEELPQDADAASFRRSRPSPQPPRIT